MDSRHQRRVGFLITFLVIGFVLVNLFSLLALFQLMPQRDFGVLYYSARTFLDGGDMYGLSPATVTRLDNGLELQAWNMNPPHFHLLLLPLALLTPRQALVLWLVAGFAALTWSIRLILLEARPRFGTHGQPLTILAGLAFAGTTSVLLLGQVSFLLLVPITLMWRDARHGRWTRAGALLGLVASLKLFLLLFLPYLALRRRWRALLGAAAVFFACYGAGVLVFGLDNHLSWIDRLRIGSGSAWLPSNGSILGLLRRTFAPSPFFTPLLELPDHIIQVTWLVLGATIGVLTLQAALKGNSPGDDDLHSAHDSPESVDRAFALLLTGALLISPLGWVYYYWFPVGPIAALLTRRRGATRAQSNRGTVASRDGAMEASRDGMTTAGRGRRRLARCLLFAALPGLFWPIFATRAFQPSLVATLLIGNVYFWGALSVWTILLLGRSIYR